MGFSLLTATSRMWLLRKRILPGREMLVSWVIPAKGATGIWDPNPLGPLPWLLSISAGHQVLLPLAIVKETREEQSPLSGGRRCLKLRAQDLSGSFGAPEAAILSRSPCVGLMARSMPTRETVPK